MTEVPKFQSGTVLNDRYVVEYSLGTGGYSEVFAARDLQFDRSVALKVLHAHAIDQDPRAVARMRQEAEILRAISHPNIVQIFAVDSFEGGEFLVMEQIDGVGLNRVLEEIGTFDSARLVPLVRQMLDALQAAHATEILHRDIKPENILLTEQSGEETIKLVDFGVAKAGAILNADDSDEGVTLVKTRAGNFVGTPRYTAPEMVVGDPSGPGTDLFCIGLVVYEALVGKSLIQGTTHNQLMQELVYPRPFDLDEVPAPWPQWLSPILEKAPDRRLASAGEARQSLDALFSPGSSSTQRSDISSPARNFQEYDDDSLYPAFGDSPDLADTEVSEHLADEIAETNQWTSPDIDIKIEKEDVNPEVRVTAEPIDADEKSTPAPARRTENSSTDAILQFVFFALLAFVVAGLLILWWSN